MKTISPKDASLLALLAERPASKSSLRRQILNRLDSEGLTIATEMGKKGLLPATATDDQTKAAATARGLVNWAKSNKLHKSSRGHRKAK